MENLEEIKNKIKVVPAPWDLNGYGYIFIYKFKKDFVNSNANIPDFLKGKFCGGFGAVMLVNYKSSNVGPYGELLFIPGKFKFNNKKLDTISKIYVSSYESVICGRENWGIPKEKADFEFIKKEDSVDEVIVSVDNKKVVEAKLKSRKLSFPVSTKLLPFPLIQEYKGKYLYTNFYGKGKGRLVKIESIKVDKTYFPDISNIKPIAVIKVDPFDITFPLAKENK